MDILKTLNDIERQFPVDTWEIDDVKVWPYIRFLLGFKLFGKPNKSESATFVKRMFDRYGVNLFKYISAYLKDLKNNQGLKKADVFVLDNGTQPSEVDRKFLNIRSDPILLEFLKERKTYIKMIFGDKYKTPRYLPGIFIQYKLDLISLSSILKRKIFKQKHNACLEKYEEFLRHLEKLNISTKFLTISKILSGMEYMFSYKRYFLRVLKKVKPKVAFTTCYDSTYSFGFQLACHELNIPSVDIQHGASGEAHFAYARWNNVPKEGYSMLPKIFYIWGTYEKKSIEAWSSKTNYHKVFVGGNNFVSMWKDEKSSWVKNSDREIKEIMGSKKYSKVILYTLGSFEPDKSINEVIKKSPSDWFWFIKPHPIRLDYADLVKKEIEGCKCGYEIDKTKDLPLFGILRFCDVHVTERSTVIIEAGYFGIKSIATMEESKDVFPDHYKNGFMVYSTDVDEVFDCLNTLKKVKKGMGSEDIKKFEPKVFMKQFNI